MLGVTVLVQALQRQTLAKGAAGQLVYFIVPYTSISSEEERSSAVYMGLWYFCGTLQAV